MENSIIKSKKYEEIIQQLSSNCSFEYLENNIEFAIKVGLEYDNLRTSFSQDNRDIAIQYYQFICVYFLTYLAKKYDKHFSYDIFSDNETTCYNSSLDIIKLASKNVNKSNFDMILFAIFHEFRHKMQFDDMKSKKDNLLQIDPAAIIFLKEIKTMEDRDLYDNNHSCFMMENDATLFGINESRKYCNAGLLKKIYNGEQNNYIKAIMDGTDLSTQEYDTIQNLPIIYEIDYRAKKKLSGKQISDDSLLSLIYKLDGKPKTYQELMTEKSQLIKKYNNEMLIKNTSTSDYENRNIRPVEHIEEIYKLIVASDPILTIEECFFYYNSTKEKLYKEKRIKKIQQIFENCPQLSDMYCDEITTLFIEQLMKGNIDTISNLTDTFANSKIKDRIETVIKIRNMSVRSSMKKNVDAITDEDIGMEEETNRKKAPKVK